MKAGRDADLPGVKSANQYVPPYSLPLLQSWDGTNTLAREGS